MKKSKIIKKILIISIHMIVICFMLFFTWLFIAITPYQGWDISLKYIDEDKLLFLKSFCFITMFFNAVIAAVSRLYSKTFFAVHLVMTQLYIAYFCWLYTV